MSSPSSSSRRKPSSNKKPISATQQAAKIYGPQNPPLSPRTNLNPLNLKSPKTSPRQLTHPVYETNDKGETHQVKFEQKIHSCSTFEKKEVKLTWYGDENDESTNFKFKAKGWVKPEWVRIEEEKEKRKKLASGGMDFVVVDQFF